MKTVSFLAITLMLTMITGCTIMDGNSIVTGNARSPISAEMVRLYRTAPEKFEEIAVVSASAGHDFKKSSSLLNSAIQRLKEEAAKLGANGVLLSEIDERDVPAVTTNYGAAIASGGGSSVYATGNSISVNRGDTFTKIRGIAIFVDIGQENARIKGSASN